MTGPNTNVESSRVETLPSQPSDDGGGDDDRRDPEPGVAVGPGFFDRDGQPIDLARYVELHADPEYRVVARDAADGREVVTVWLGIDHGPLADTAGPLIFGTVALEPDGQLWQGRELFAATEAEARSQHDLVRRELAQVDR